MSKEHYKTPRVELKVEVRDREGRLVGVRSKESDLILNNFKEMLAGIWAPRTSVGVTRALVHDGGAAVDVNMLLTSPLFNTGAESGAVIGVGTSTVAPTRDDYKLGAPVKGGTPTLTVGADYVSWAISLVLDAAADIAEAGMSCVYCRADNILSWFLMFRDTFTPISVPAGGTISVTYTLTL